MDILSFGIHSTDEVSCREHFKVQGDEQGVTCKRYGGQY